MKERILCVSITLSPLKHNIIEVNNDDEFKQDDSAEQNLRVRSNDSHRCYRRLGNCKADNSALLLQPNARLQGEKSHPCGRGKINALTAIKRNRAAGAPASRTNGELHI